MRIYRIGLICLLVLLHNAYGAAYLSQTRNVLLAHPYQGISADGDVTLSLLRSPIGDPIVITGDGDAIKKVNVSVLGHNLVIALPHHYSPTHPTKIQIPIGGATSLAATLAGTATLMAEDLQFKSIDLTCQDQSKATVYVTNFFKANTSGNSQVIVYGNPRLVEANKYDKSIVTMKDNS